MPVAVGGSNYVQIYILVAVGGSNYVQIYMYMPVVPRGLKNIISGLRGFALGPSNVEKVGNSFK